MKTPATRLQSSAASLMATILIGSTFAVSELAMADPQTKPTLTLAPYVLKDTDLRRGATNAFRPWFENGAWTGDLIEYNISEQGERCTSVVPGSYPPDDSGNHDPDQCPHFNWSARGAFPDKIEQADGTLVDDADTANYWREDRNLIIFDAGNLVDQTALFWWAEDPLVGGGALNDYQKWALDSSTCGPLVDGMCSSDTYDQTDPTASLILNFVRGDRSEERDKPGGVFRLRYSVLGPVINSRPVFVPAGDNGLVVVGANDGIIHGFDASNGSEVFGYVPSIFFPTLKNLVDSPYSLTYFADGELRSRQIAPGRHIVTGGFGAGGKGLFALEINASNPGNPKLLFELSGTEGAHIAGDVDPSIGHIYGRPTVARLPDGRWYVVAGNGYNSGSGARLVLIDIETGVVDYIDAPGIPPEPDPENGLSAPALVSSTSSFTQSDFAYAGDLKGNLYRFNLETKTADLLFAAGETKPITVEPDIARHPTSVGIMVYFGTGRLLNVTDASDESALMTQSIYGIWDETFTTTNIDDTQNDDTQKLITQSLEERTDEVGIWDGDRKTVRILLNSNEPLWVTENKNLGWKVDLMPGERLLGRPQVRAKRLQFITTNPGDGSWFNQLSLASGGTLDDSTPLYDLDRSGELDAGDAWSETTAEGETKTLYPLGLNLGAGNIAQPAFASVTTDIDAVFINALLLPSPIDPPADSSLGGTLDVTTDSPAGPRVDPHDPEHPKYDEYGYGDKYPDYGDVPAARGPMNTYLAEDGLGERVDGHHRAYNKVHAIDYVDFFDLEPQARKVDGLRLDPGWLDSNGEPFKAMRELNQPSEDPWGEPLIASDKEFIVLLTNADLSLGANIQIGCRKWNAFEYQEMVTSQLLAGKTPSQLLDDKGRGLVFTLDNILADTGGGAGCDVNTKTLRVSFSGQVGSSLPDDFGTPVLMGTLPGCVNNTHDYVGEPVDPTTDPFPHPHITPNQENPNGGYRWRNGALTMQLLDIESYELELVHRPTAKSNSPTLGKGGLYAKAFDINKIQGNDVITPLDGPNGLLYESSIFWNWGDMWEFQQEGFKSVCYGAANYNSAFVNELGGLNKAQYDQLVSNLRTSQALQDEYSGYLLDLEAARKAGDEAGIILALQNLHTVFQQKAGEKAGEIYSIGYYHILRNYAHGDKFTSLDLLDIDKDLFQPPDLPEVSIDGTPADVQDVELDLLPAAGPNFAPGRRSWVDITPE